MNRGWMTVAGCALTLALSAQLAFRYVDYRRVVSNPDMVYEPGEPAGPVRRDVKGTVNGTPARTPNSNSIRFCPAATGGMAKKARRPHAVLTLMCNRPLNNVNT